MKRVITLFIIFCLFFSGCEMEKKENINVTFLDVGNADCQIIMVDNKTVMIDTALANQKDKIFEFLDKNNIDKIDVLILTHFDKDHIGTASEIINELNVDLIYENSLKKHTNSTHYKSYKKAIKENRSKVIPVNEQIEFEFNDAKFKIYPPKSDRYLNNESNNSSLMVTLKYNETSFLFAADIEKDRIAEVIDVVEERYDILKIPHHGYYEENTYEFLSALMPKFAIITTSNKKAPSPKTLSELLKLGIEVYLTVNGDITISSNGTSYKLEQK